VEERARASSSEVEDLAALLVLATVRIERLFELCEANHRRADDLELVCRETRKRLQAFEKVFYSSR
jgi:hypothetical protein